MKRYKLLTLLTCLALCAASPSFADRDHKHDRRWERDRHEQHHVHRDPRHGRAEPRHHHREHDRRSHWFHDHGYSRLSIPARYYPGPGHCRIWYPDRPAWNQPKVQKHCGVAPRGAWVIEHPRHKPNHVHVVVNEPWSYGPQLIGEFEIASGIFVRLLTNL